MSRKHCTKHPERGKSRYPQRLVRRGHPRTTMEPLERLRRQQGADTVSLPDMPKLNLRALRAEREDD